MPDAIGDFIGGIFGGPDAPDPVDYEGAAQAEGEWARRNVEAQTWANRPNQINPWGQVSWTPTPYYDPTTGQQYNQWTQQTTLSPALQEALSYQMGLMSGRSQLGYGMLGNVAQDIGQRMDWSQFGPMAMPQGINQLSDQGAPQLVGSLAGALPEYQTQGAVRQLDFSDAPQVMAPQFGIDRAENAIYNRAWSRLGPQQQSEQQSMDIKLRNQGLVPGDQAYDSAMQNLSFKQNDQQQALMNEAIMGGGREAERLLGMETGFRGLFTGEQSQAAQFANQAAQQDFEQQMRAGGQSWQDLLQAAQFQNQARGQALGQQQQLGAYNQDLQFRMADYYNNLRQQMINEEIARRGYSLNEINALLSGQQVGLPQFNSFMGAGLAQAPQLLQAAAYQGQANAAQAGAQNAYQNSMLGGLGSLAGAFGMFSDRRLKRNIKPIGERNGIRWYSFDYVWGESAVGVMADEVPHAAFLHPSGFWMVDYSRV